MILRFKVYLGCIGWILGGCLAGCQTNEGKASGSATRAPHSGVGLRDVDRAAQTVEQQSPGRLSGPGKGQSMAPLYGSNSYVVIDEIDFYDLEPGMVVVYRNSSGHNVAHQLVRRDGFTWIVEGINNRRIDGERVTPENLIGVVYASFHGTP